MVERESTSPEETERIGAAVARELAPGDVVAVSGELGSGKTTFVRGAARGLGIAGPVTSPSYTIGHRYPGDPDVSHLDLYRFVGMADAEWGDLEPYFDEAVVFVEWPEAGEAFLPPPRVRVRLRHHGEGHRLISLESAEKSLEIRLTSGADPRV
jgi:tRNA threonylcarbamoyladenosine biosynthesis protein TsaE